MEVLSLRFKLENGTVKSNTFKNNASKSFPMLSGERYEAIVEFNTWLGKLDMKEVKLHGTAVREKRTETLENFLKRVQIDDCDASIKLFLIWWSLEGGTWFEGKYGSKGDDVV